MNSRNSAAALMTASVLAACASQPTPIGNDGTGSPSTGMAQACNADAAQGAVGKVATSEVVEQARRDAGAIIARVLKPGQVVTMEYRGDRVNVDVDEANVVTAVRCG